MNWKIGLIMGLIVSGSLFAQDYTETVTLPDYYLKPNGFKSGVNKALFVGGSGTSIKVGVGTDVPTALLDFDRSDGKPFELIYRYGSDQDYLFIDMDNVSGLNTDFLGLGLKLNSGYAYPLLFTENMVFMNFHTNTTDVIGKLIEETISNTQLDLAGSLILSNGNYGIPNSLLFSHNGAFSNMWEYPKGLHSNSGPNGTSAHWFNSQMTPYGASDFDGSTVYSASGIVGTAFSAGTLRGGSDGNKAGKLYAAPRGTGYEGKNISFGFPEVSSTRKFAIYVDEQPLYFNDAIGTSRAETTSEGFTVFTTGTTKGNLSVYRHESSDSNKTFVIQHPDKLDRFLVHSALETPENRVFYYGESRLIDGQAIVQLPVYFEKLTHPYQRHIQLTSIDVESDLAVQIINNEPIVDGQFVVVSNRSTANHRFNWRVTAIRSDVQFLNTEPEKSSINLQGEGPYRFGVDQ